MSATIGLSFLVEPACRGKSPLGLVLDAVCVLPLCMSVRTSAGSRAA